MKLTKDVYPVGTGKYRKKPVAVYAVKFNPRQRNWPPTVYGARGQFYVRTASGDVEIQEGTWICWQRVAGRVDVWPVKPDIFAATYEAAL